MRKNVKLVTLQIPDGHIVGRVPVYKPWIFNGTRNVNMTHLGQLRRLKENFKDITFIEH